MGNSKLYDIYTGVITTVFRIGVHHLLRDKFGIMVFPDGMILHARLKSESDRFHECILLQQCEDSPNETLFKVSGEVTIYLGVYEGESSSFEVLITLCECIGLGQVRYILDIENLEEAIVRYEKEKEAWMAGSHDRFHGLLRIRRMLRKISEASRRKRS